MLGHKPVHAVFCLLSCLMLLTPALAADPEEPAVTEIPPLVVTPWSTPWADGSLPAVLLQAHAGRNLAEALEDLPGVWLMRQAASGAEPVIRGLGYERVQTVVGAVPLYGACPGRMDPPATYLGGPGTHGVTLLRSGGGVGTGPGGTGGGILVDPDYRRPAGSETELKTLVEAGYGSAREGHHTRLGFEGGTRTVDVSFGVERVEKDDYEAPDGTLVPAGLDKTAASASVGLRLSDHSRIWNAVTYVKEQDVDFPALPMDNLDTDFWVYNAGWRQDFPGRTLARIEITGGFSVVDHLMGNAYKPTAATLDAVTDADTRTQAGHARFQLKPGDGLHLETGFDFNRLTRDATRTRHLVLPGDTFHDRMWPDAVQESFGGFADLAWPVARGWDLKLTARVDVVDSKARAADAASLGGLTVRQQYIRFYGDQAGETERSETLGAATLRLEKAAFGQGRWFVQGAASSRAAGITERFNAFGPTPGGFLVGDPSLAAEKKLEGEAGLQWRGENLQVRAAAFVAGIRDYILPTVILRADVNGDEVPDNVKGFANVDARLYGGELGVQYRPADTIAIPVTVAYVRGENTSEDRNLPEIPPLSATAEIRARVDRGTGTWLTFGGFFAADQDEIDPAFPENRTPGYAVFHLGLESRPVMGLTVRAGVENLFDRRYHDHLTRSALLPVGGLAAGQEIPAPGRDVRLSARWEF